MTLRIAKVIIIFCLAVRLLMTQVMSCISVKKLNIDNSYLCMYAASKTSRVAGNRFMFGV